MNKLYKGILILAAIFVAACADENLDPLRFNTVKKGTILALRGQQLTNIYFDGTPGAEFFPRIINGTETFDFDAEILATDPSVLSSFDIYVVKRIPAGTAITLERILLTNVPFSEFKTTDEYRNPWVSVSLNLTDVLDKLGLDYTNPTDVNTILDTYKFGIAIESDLNLTDGSKVLASEITAAGLFQSDQFYPAQRLTYTVTDYCTYDAAFWNGTFTANEVYENGVYGPYNISFSPDPGGVPNRFVTSNFWDSGLPAYIDFTPSTGPDDQIVLFPTQPSGGAEITSTSGTYDQCTGKFSIQTQFDGNDFRYEFTKQ
jgi:hypothetical protein